MPLELIAVAPRKLELRSYEEPPLKAGQVRVKSRLCAEKHGTNLPGLKGISPVGDRTYDAGMGVFMPVEPGKAWGTRFPRGVGNMAVGMVVEAGPGVKKLKVGDRVFGHLPVRETHTVDEARVHLAPEGVGDEDLVCVDPVLVALLAVREGNVRLGDTVAVFGLGAIGLMAVQLARLSGTMKVIAIEPHGNKRALALRYGADLTLDPTKCDAGLEVRKATGGKGVDVGIETSGAHAALHQTIRGTCYGGTIVPVAWYSGGATDLRLGEEWHFNRQVMVSGARLESQPYRDHPRWDSKRVEHTAVELFQKKRLTVEGMLQPKMPLSQAAEAYRIILDEPQKAVKCAITFS